MHSIDIFYIPVWQCERGHKTPPRDSPPWMTLTTVGWRSCCCHQPELKLRAAHIFDRQAAILRGDTFDMFWCLEAAARVPSAVSVCRNVCICREWRVCGLGVLTLRDFYNQNLRSKLLFVRMRGARRLSCAHAAIPHQNAPVNEGRMNNRNKY